ncbi:metalloprotease TldD [Terriglobus sp.]|uniref:metalloprotease TldD n=1 Tax=Terriglobus sp. TaxID=1889013 RepID=UPI003B00031C
MSSAFAPTPSARANTIFHQQFGVTDRLIERCLAAALERGGDFAELFFESTASNGISVDEGIVKSASQGHSMGCGVRVLNGERTGYSYTDELTEEKMLHAARTAALIADSATSGADVQGFSVAKTHDLYPAATTDVEIAQKLQLVQRADRAARAYDPRITQVRATFNDEVRHILVVASDGTYASDVQPLSRFSVGVIAKDAAGDGGKGASASGTSGGGGRRGFDWYTTERTPEHYAREAARQAILQLTAQPAPAGEMPVVLGPGWPGVLIHEAVGHGLEADFNRKKQSAFAGLMGQRVGTAKVTVADNGIMPNRRGSLNVDDEGVPTANNVLIEKGMLCRYMSDKLSAKLMGARSTGSGRRESYASIPMPRMTNTYMLAGEDDPADILRSVQKGIYAVNFSGGSVDITNGKFVFAANEAYLIEDGKVTAPVKGAMLIGDGATALTRVSMVGHDLALDEGVGTCGKKGQGVPVCVGAPTVKLDHMTVGGTGR